VDSEAKCFIGHMSVYAHFCGLHSDTAHLVHSITVLLLFQQVLLLKRTVMDVQD